MSKRVIITGATGFIGKVLCFKLAEAGYDVVALSRNIQKSGTKQGKISFAGWDGKSAEGWGKLADGALAIINLAGENIGSGFWTVEKKKKIIESRINAGKAVTEAVELVNKKPEAVIQASAVGHYGSRGDELLEESSKRGSGFLSDVTQHWEQSTEKVIIYGVRQVIIRIGVVLGKEGGILSKVMLPFKFFAGGHPGKGNHWLSWIHIEDVANAIKFLIGRNDLSGVFNLSSPEPVTAKHFFSAVGKTMRRPSFLHQPAFILKVFLGEMAEELLLSSQRVMPERLIKSGYEFLYPNLEKALKQILNK